MNIYKGAGSRHVTVNGKPLSKCLHIIDHSPAGFSWGCPGSGSAQLALAIMVQEFGCDLHNHPIHYQDLKREVIVNFESQNSFVLTTTDIQAWLTTHQQASA